MFRHHLSTSLSILLLLVTAGPISAQTRPSATPVSAILLSPTPESLQVAVPSITPIPSPTSVPSARLQALESAGSVNVRALPDIESDIQGTIAHGTEYPVVRNYFRWYELLYDLSPNGRAWVYGDLVTITGERSRIEIIDNLNAIALAGEGVGEQSGADERTIEISTVRAGSARSVELVNATALPTFTYAPTQAPFTQQIVSNVAGDQANSELPPIVPILALGGFGLFGLLISLIRS